MDLAICLLAFARPWYFRRVLASLRRQPDVGDVSVYCFLDGAVNPFSRARHAAAADIRACGNMFTKACPRGELHASPVNLGIALNYHRAERYLFVRRRHAYVLFLEDDFVLLPHYLRVIRAMIREFGDNRRVGAFSAFGDHSPSLRDQRRHRHSIRVMGHQWAFCVPRARWLERRAKYAAYLRYVRHIDYVQRSHEWIRHTLYRRWGAKPIATSQDAAKAIAMIRAGQISISTYTNNGLYIGQRGTHFSPDIFARLGYRERAGLVYPQSEERFDWTQRDLDAIEAEMRRSFLLTDAC